MWKSSNMLTAVKLGGLAMTLDPNKYIKRLALFKDKIKKSTDIGWDLSDIAQSNQIPVMAVVLYAMRTDVLGPIEELVLSSKVISNFYEYDKIIDWE